MRKEITLDERRDIQLNMLDELHTFCKKHGLKYSLTWGTLIGAIRHKGFIPWDDDVDIMMPLPDLIKLKEGLTSEMIRYCDVDTEPHYEYGFSRIVHNDTYRLFGMGLKQYGINIDLYPIISVPDNQDDEDVFFNKAIKLFYKRISYLRWCSRIQRLIPISTIPGYDKSIREYRNHVLYCSPKYGTTNKFYIFDGPMNEYKKQIYDFDFFDNLITVKFEDREYFSIAKYDSFLRHFYGNYMELPPEEQRIPYHGGHYYWK